MVETARHVNPSAAFACRQCGACCRVPGHVLLQAGEADAIAGFLGLASADFIARYTALAANRAGLSLVEQPEGACVFLNDRNRCSIEAVKPEQCRTFPQAWRFADAERTCPGLAQLMQESAS
jgi:uncharacterized protein